MITLQLSLVLLMFFSASDVSFCEVKTFFFCFSSSSSFRDGNVTSIMGVTNEAKTSKSLIKQKMQIKREKEKRVETANVQRG
jgi:hypothetical protein